MTAPPYLPSIVRPGLLLFLLVALPAACGADDRPSVLLITVDTLRADAVGVYGNSGARTPRMDRLAAAGIRFERAKSTCPITLPSHLTILTGVTPPEHGIRDNDPERPLPGPDFRDFATLAERFRKEGYATAAFVSASVVAKRTGLDAGFTVYDGPTGSVPGSLVYAERTGEKTAAHAADWMAAADRPFFVWVHLFDPHDPYVPPVAFRSGAAPDSPEAYADEVAYADHCVGAVLDAIEGTDTLVVLTSDHGEGLGEHEESTHAFLLYETTLAVPLVISRPGHLAEGEARPDVVGLADLAPTILDAAGIEDDERSFLDGPTQRIPVAETLYGYRHMGWAQLVCAWDGETKLVEGAPDAWFDLAADPREANPLSTGPERLRERIRAYRTTPLRVGKSPSESLEPLAGHAYLSGVGRGRLAFLSVAENRKLLPPDGRRVDEIGRLFGRVGRDDPAAVGRALRHRMDEDPKNPSLPFWLGRNEKAAGRYADAARAFGRSFELGHREARVLALWLQSLILSEQIEEGLAIGTEMVTQIVPDTAVWVMLGTLQMQSGKHDTAVRSAEKAARLARSERERKLVSSFRHKLR
ncbi:MAG: sulfatase-like hydrolase/transferase [Planctomycetota bacterium]